MTEPQSAWRPREHSRCQPQWWPHGGELPKWEVWAGTDGWCYASLADSPAVIVRGRNPGDLRDQIRQAMLRAVL